MHSKFNSKVNLFLGIAIIALLFSSCESLPAPQYPDDTVLIIPVQKILESGGSTFAYARIKITKPEDPLFRKYVNIYANSGNTVITGLPAGEYTFASYSAMYKGTNDRAWEQEVNAPFTIEASYINFSPVVLVMKIHAKDEDDSSAYMSLWTEKLDSRMREKVIDELDESPNFAAWKLHPISEPRITGSKSK